VLITLYSNPFTIVPLYWLAFKMGQLVLMQSGGELPSFAVGLQGKGFMDWLSMALQWLTSVGKPLLIGLPLLATLLALIGYFVTDWAWRLGVMWQWRQRKIKRNRNTTR
jgi:uncharacterized protein (DUF2062 family)